MPARPHTSKLGQVQQAMAAGDWPRAFAIAARFPRLGAQRTAIRPSNGLNLISSVVRNDAVVAPAAMACRRFSSFQWHDVTVGKLDIASDEWP